MPKDKHKKIQNEKIQMKKYEKWLNENKKQQMPYEEQQWTSDEDAQETMENGIEKENETENEGEMEEAVSNEETWGMKERKKQPEQEWDYEKREFIPKVPNSPDFATASEKILHEFRNKNWIYEKNLSSRTELSDQVDAFKDKLTKIFVDEEGKLENKYGSFDKIKLFFSKITGNYSKCKNEINSKILKKNIEQKQNQINHHISDLENKIEYSNRTKNNYKEDIINIKMEGIAISDYAKKFEARLKQGKNQLTLLKAGIETKILERKFEETKTLVAKIMRTEKCIYEMEKERDECSLKIIYCNEKIKRLESYYARTADYEKILSRTLLVLKESRDNVKGVLEEYTKIGTPQDMKEYVALSEQMENMRESIEEVFNENANITKYSEETMDEWEETTESIHEKSRETIAEQENKSKMLYEKAIQIAKYNFLKI